MRLLLSLFAATILLTACGGDGRGTTPSPSPESPAAPSPKPTPAGKLTVTSSAFRDGQPIGRQYSCKGANTSPPLAWQGVPEDAAALALVMDDPDAVGGLYIHWVVTDIAPDSTGVAAGKTPAGGTVTPNSGGDARYLGPCPPSGTGTHHYRFTVYALPAPLNLAADTPAKQAVATIERQATTQARLVGTSQG